MLQINSNNIEELIFYDKILQKKLPEFAHIFNQWAFSKQHSSLKFLGKKSALDLLNQLDNVVDILSSHFSTNVIVQKFDYSTVKHLTCHIDELEKNLQDIKDYYYCNYREGDYVYISFWR